MATPSNTALLLLPQQTPWGPAESRQRSRVAASGAKRLDVAGILLMPGLRHWLAYTFFVACVEVQWKCRVTATLFTP
jgi:hypothetical protein